jgi:hypothetical protein
VIKEPYHDFDYIIGCDFDHACCSPLAAQVLVSGWRSLYMGKFNLLAGLIGFGLFATSAIQAQAPTPKPESVTVNTTGCLVRTDKAHQYSITDESGKTFELLSGDGINMKKHVGQKVMVTGIMTKERKGAREGVEYLRVDQVKRIDKSC